MYTLAEVAGWMLLGTFIGFTFGYTLGFKEGKAFGFTRGKIAGSRKSVTK
jgi:hypothetical protein